MTQPGEALIDVSVVEDHPLYRIALVQVLMESGCTRVGTIAGSVEEFASFRAPPGGVVVLDLKLPGLHDASAVVAVTSMGHRVLVVSAQADKAAVLAAVAAGARGFLTKDAEAAEIIRAVREVAAGHTYVSPVLASMLLDSSRERYTALRLPLSDRERQVLGLLAAGERDQDIAEALAISVRTVRSHLDRIREKTGRRRRPELTRLAIEEGIATDPPVHRASP